MILAAGLGTRMRPLTNDRPKPLIEVRGKALIDHAIDRLVQAGVTMIVVNAYYHADKLKEHLAKRRDVEIQISEEGEVLLGTGGAYSRFFRNSVGSRSSSTTRIRSGGRLRPRARSPEGALEPRYDGFAAPYGLARDRDRL